METTLKPSKLEFKLQELAEVPCTAVGLEQYQTPPHIAAYLLWEISEHFGTFTEKVVLDLGCGNGILGIGCLLLGAKFVLAVDVSSASIEVAKCNAERCNFSTEQISFMNQDVRCFDSRCLGAPSLGVPDRFDVVVMNPPFGTKNQVGIDAVFVEKALESADVVYSMHKTTTRKFWIRKGVKLGVEVTSLTNMKFNLENSFKFHKCTSKDIEVDLLQFKHSCV